MINKIEILPNMIEIPSSVEKEINKNPKFLFLGKISKKKGIEDLLEAIKSISKHSNFNFEVLIAGNGNVEWLKKEIINRDIEAIVKYIGWVSKNEKLDWLSKTDIMLLPSYYEGFPVSLLEGMSFSMPLIATNVGGIPLVLENNENGILIEPKNISDLEKAIMFYLENPENIKIHGRASFNKVQQYTPKKVIAKLENIYSLVINEE